MDALNRTKYIIYWSLGVLVLAVLGFLAWQYIVPVINRSPETPGATEPVSGGVGSFPTGSIGEKLQERDQPFLPVGDTTTGPAIPPGDQQLIQLTDFSVVAPSLNEKGDAVLFYKKDGGDLLKSDFNGETDEKLSHITIVGISEALWSPPKRDRAAVFYLDGETLKGFLHIGTSSVAVLPTNTQSFSWSPNGSQLAYLVREGEELALVVADSSAKNAKTVFRTPLLDAKIIWITNDTISFQTAPSAFADGFMFLYSRGSGKFTKILGPLRGLSTNWSPDGKRVLVSSTVGGGNTALNVYDSAGKQIFLTGLATIAEKCAWSFAERLYCAVPKETAPNVVWPDDYLRGELNTVDRVVRIDLKTKETTEVFSGESSFFDMSDLVLTPDEKYFFFVNRFDGTLWRLKTK